MKHPNVTSPKQDDAAALKQELVFLKAREECSKEEMSRLREEKNEAIESKFSLMAEMGGLKEKVKELTETLSQALDENRKLKEESENSTRERHLEREEMGTAAFIQQKPTSKVWMSSRTKFVCHIGSSWFTDVLNCAPLKSGTFEWKIQVHSAYSDSLFLGVIGSSVKLPLTTCWIGYTKKTWGYESCHGNASYWNDGQKQINNLPKYNSGSVVHFFLDLTKDGTLCVSVDGPIVQLFSNMKSLLDHDEGFLPATSIHATSMYGSDNNNIELLEFKSLPIDISSVMIQKTLYS